jgi:predicted RNA-binding Zn ribbon-like protein
MEDGSRLESRELPARELGFHFKSGRLCLAFCATVGERWRRNFERLRQPDDLARWVGQAGLVAQAPIPGERVLVEARILREAIYRSVRTAMAGRSIGRDDRNEINRWAARPDLGPQLGSGRKRRVVAPAPVIEACLASVARDAVELLSSGDIERVRECAAKDCALLFFDQSRPGRRQWCADTACGARTRTARYRRRKESPGGRQPQPSRTRSTRVEQPVRQLDRRDI